MEDKPIETDILIWARFILLAVSALLLIFVLIRLRSDGARTVEQAVREELRFGREEAAKSAKDLRQEVFSSQKYSLDTMVKIIGEMGKVQSDQLESIAKHIQELTESNKAGIEKLLLFPAFLPLGFNFLRIVVGIHVFNCEL